MFSAALWLLLIFPYLFFFYCYADRRDLHSFPPRRSSDLLLRRGNADHVHDPRHDDAAAVEARDRKSTRLNSSHTVTSYAVFCLKKKRTILPMALAPRRRPARHRGLAAIPLPRAHRCDCRR